MTNATSSAGVINPGRLVEKEYTGMVSSSDHPSTGYSSSEQSPSHNDALPPVSHPWTHRDSAIVAGLWALVAVAFAALSVAAHIYPEFPGDVGLTVLIQKIQFPPLVHFIRFVSDANGPVPAGYTSLAIILALLVARQLSAVIATVVASFGGDLFSAIINGIVARPRPHNVQIHALANLGLHSYPSGHVTHVVTLYGFLLYLSFHLERPHPRWKPLFWVVRIISIYFIALIGVSRVLEGEHWPSDVLGSYLLASLLLVIAIALYHLLLATFARLRERRQLRKAQAA